MECYQEKVDDEKMEIYRLKKQIDDYQKQCGRETEKKQKMKEEQNYYGIQEDNEQKLHQYKDLRDVINKWKNWISVSEHNFE